MKFPVILRLLLPLLIGVILHFYTGISISLVVGLLFLAIVVFLSTPQISKLRFAQPVFNIGYILFFFFLGGYLAHVHKSSENPNYFAYQGEEWNNYLVKVLEPPQEKERSIKCVVEVIQVNDRASCGKSLIYLQKEPGMEKPEYGDLIYFNGRFNEIKSNGNPKEFDYARYLRIHNIREQTYIKTEKWKKVGNEANIIFKFVYGLRAHFSSVLENCGMSDKNAMVANALILGQKEYLDKDVLRSYSSAGAMHVLAVSGLHVGIIMLMLNFLAGPIKKIRHGKKLFLLIVLGGIWFYALITGLSPSVMRAAVMFTFIVIGKELERDTNVYQSILVSAFLLIIIEPYIIFQVGFQLSYLAVLGIVFLQPKIVNLIYVKNKILNKAWQISAVSIAAQIATFPLGLYYFHQFPNFFLLSNLLVIPLAFLILILGISYLALNRIPILSDIIFWVFDGMISILNWGVELVEKLPYSILWGISIEWYEVFVLYVTILLGSIAFMYRRSKALIASLVGCVVLLCFNVWENQKLHDENVLYIYNVSDELAIDVFYGRQNVFYSTKAFMADEEKLLFHVKHNWFYRTGREDPVNWNDISDLNYLKTGDNLFSVIDSVNHDKQAAKIPKVHYLIVHDLEFMQSEILDASVKNGTTIILASNVGYKLRNFMAKKEGLKVFDLKEKGAFELYF